MFVVRDAKPTGEGAPMKRQKLVNLQIADPNLHFGESLEEMADSSSLYNWPMHEDVFDQLLYPDSGLQEQQVSTQDITASSLLAVDQAFADCLASGLTEVMYEEPSPMSALFPLALCLGKCYSAVPEGNIATPTTRAPSLATMCS